MKHIPVEGRWLNDVPHVEHDCDDDFHILSGAFTGELKPKRVRKKKTPKPPPVAAATTPESPPDGGLLAVEET